MADTCNVTGTIIAPDGSPLARVTVIFQKIPEKAFVADSSSGLPHAVRAITDSSGGIDVSLLPGVYYVKPQGASYPPFRIDVPDEPTANLADIQDDILQPPPSEILQAVTDARAARDQAEGYRDGAQVARTGAEQARDAAQAAQTGAEAARTAAETAQSGAQAARTAAEAAQGAAEAARDTAESARDDARLAKAGAESARDEAQTAETGAVNAWNSAFNLYGDLQAIDNALNQSLALYGGLSEVQDAVTQAEGFADAASASLQAAQEITGGAYGIGTQPMELPRNTELGSGAFAPYEAHSLYPILPTGSRTLTPDDNGKIVWSVGHNVTLPDSTAPGMQPGWRVWIKNTDGVSSLTIDCAASDTLDGGTSITLSAGESRLLVLIATGQFGSL